MLERRLRVEVLEDRRLLAVYLVSSLDDSGEGSLRSAISLSNLAEGADTILFASELSGGTIALTTGELTITDSLTINGPGSNRLTIDASGNDPTAGVDNHDGSRIFSVDNGDRTTLINATISGLTLTGGDVLGDGGAIRNTENLMIVNSVITGNAAGGLIARTYDYNGNTYSFDRLSAGGGIANFEGSAKIFNTTITNNAAASGGGISNLVGNLEVYSSSIWANVAQSYGGGIHSGGIGTGSLTVVSSTITGNSGDGIYVGDANYGVYSCDVLVVDTEISGNEGNGLSLQTKGDAIISDATINGNTGLGIDSSFSSGTLSVLRTTISDNAGGGLQNYADYFAFISECIITANTGFGIANRGRLMVSHSTVSDNVGVGISNGDLFSSGDELTVEHSTISGNTNRGIINYFGSISVLGSTISGNTTTNTGGGIYSRGAGTLEYMATVSIVDSFITDNASGTGGGIGGRYTNVSVAGTTISRNSANSSGGGIYVLDGTVAVADSTVSLNESNGDGGGIFNGRYQGVTAGVTITDSTISGNIAAGDGGGFYFSGYYPSVFEIVNSTISGNSANFGGGIKCRGNLTMNDSDVTNNSARGGGGGISASTLAVTSSNISGNSASSDGGGVSASSGAIVRSTVSGNFTNGNGGGIFASHLTIESTTISGNSAVTGGGISSYYLLTVTSSTISGNTAGAGGGIRHSGGTISVTNSTLSYNSGGLELINAMAAIRHSTIANNHAQIFGGGISAIGGNLELDHSIVAQNSATFSPDLATLFSASVNIVYSLIGNSADSGLVEAPIGLPDANGNLIGGPVNGTINPLLGPLADNAGQTGTHALLPGSPALNAGDPSAISNVGEVPEFDQRGAPFVRVFGQAIDIGAYERQSVPGLNPVVDTLADENDGDYGPGDLSLREAIGLANSSVESLEMIEFDPALFASGPATIVLTLGEMVIRDSLTINGPGSHLLTIDASGNDPTPNVNNGDGSRIFNIDDGSTTLADVEISGLMLTGGDLLREGGAVFNLEALSVIETTLSDNFSRGRYGGAIHSLGSLTVIDSNFSNNSTERGSGGAIGSLAAVTVSGSTFSGNRAGIAPFAMGSGGALFVRGNLIVTNSVITGNVAANSGIGGGGGIYSFDGSLTVLDSTITGNVALNGEGGGIRKRFGSFVVERTLVSGNQASSAGGGISVADGAVQARVHASTISGNSAGGALGRGGGLFVWDGNLTVTDTTIVGNSSTRGGGGIFSNANLTGLHTTRVTNTTVSGNTSLLLGGGIYNFDGLMIVQFSTITANVAPQGFGSGIDSAGDINTRTEIVGSIVAGNTNSDVDFSPGGVNSFQSNGYNLIGTGNALSAFNHPDDQTSVVDPMLGPLADNGGPTNTHALLPGSPAIDSGDPSALAGVGAVPAHDQRGFAYNRVVNGRIDIGAFETGAASADFDDDGDVDGRDFLAWQRGYGTPAPNAVKGHGDADNDTDVDGADLGVWQNQYGSEEELSAQRAGASTPPTQVEIGSVGDSFFWLPMLSLRETASDVEAFVDESQPLDVDLDEAFAELGASPHKCISDFGEIAVSRYLRSRLTSEGLELLEVE